MLILLALASCGVAHAQYVPFAHYGQSEGLRNLVISSLLQDDDGYLWAGSENGLYRYDGVAFHRYGDLQGLSNPEINALSLGPDHHLWVATRYRIYRFADGRFTPILSEGEISVSGGGSQMLFAGPDELLVVSAGTLRRLRRDARGAWTSLPYFTPGQIAEKPALANIMSLQFDAQGFLWAGCGKSLCRIRHGIVDEYGPDQGVPAGEWQALYIDSAGQLWARSVDRIVAIDTRRPTVTPHDLPGGSSTPTPGFLGFADGPGGDVLTRTDTGIARWHRGEWQLVQPLVEGQSFDVLSVLMDREGALWAGSFGHGLIRSLGYGVWESWTVREGLGNPAIWSIGRSGDGALLVGQNTGIDVLARGAKRFTRWLGKRQPARLFQALGTAQTPDGSIWAIAGAAGRLYRLPPASARMTKVASLAPIKRIMVDGEGTLWVATFDGVYALPNRPGAALFQLPGSSHLRYRDLTMDAHGRVWAATTEGLFALTLDGQRKLAFAGDDALQDFFLLSFSPADQLVAVSKNRLFSFQVNGDRAAAPKALSSPLIADATVQFIKWDSKGRLWAGTDIGLAVRQHDTWRRLSQPDGLIWNDMDENAFFADDDGSIWVGTSAGLSHLLDPGAALDPAPLRVQISAVHYGDAAIRNGDRLPWSRKSLSFDLANLSFARAGEVEFATRLIGIDDAWSVSTAATLDYTAIAPGDYRFEAYAVDSALGVRSGTIAYAVSIVPPWWRSSAFYALLAVALLLLLLLVIRISVAVLMARYRRAENQARERRVLIHRATHDALTGLLNRQSVLECLDEAMKNNAVSGGTLIVALVDLDFFKKINDTYGHLMGDKVLQQTGKVLTELSRENDVVGRFGGEEFVWLMTGGKGTFDPRRLEQMRMHLEAMLAVVDDCALGVTSSIGGARWRPGDTVETLLERADRALYRAKDRGRNTSVMADDGGPPA